MAVSGPAVTGNSLAARYGGSLVLTDGLVLATRQATINIDTQTDAGVVAGRLVIDGLGTFGFRGTATNQLVFLVFTGTTGAGTIVAKRVAGGDLRGTLSGNINGVPTTGEVSVLKGSGTPASSDTTTAATSFLGSTTGANPAADSDLAGTYSGTVRLRGNDGRRVHAVLHLDVDASHPGLFGGTFRMTGLGRYQVTGSLFDGQPLLVFTGGRGSGALVLGPAQTATNDFSGLSGKFFAMIDAVDLHGLARLQVRAFSTETGTTGIFTTTGGTTAGGTTAGGTTTDITTGTISPTPGITTGTITTTPITTSSGIPTSIFGSVGVPLVGVSPPLVDISPPLTGVSPPLAGVSSPLAGVSPPLFDISPPLSGVSAPNLAAGLTGTGTTAIRTTAIGTPGTSIFATTTGPTTTAGLASSVGGLALGGVAGPGSPFSDMMIAP
jgi:hypothetical protein